MPAIQFLEKKKTPRTTAILAIFLLLGIVFTAATVYASQVLSGQWQTILDLMPQLGDQLFEKINIIQERLQGKLSIKIDFGITQWMKNFTQETQNWLITYLPHLLGQLASAVFLVPVFSFFVLRDGKKVTDEWMKLIPSKHHSNTVGVIKKISVSK